MTYSNKTREQLLKEIDLLKDIIAELEKSETERKRAEEALRESEARIRALLNAPTDAMILIDSAGIVLAVNNTHAEWLKKSIDEIIGKCVFDFFPSDIAEFRKARTNEVFNTGKPIHFVESQKGKIFNTTVYPVFGAKGKVTAVAIYARDITERKQAEKELSESEEIFRAVFYTAQDSIFIKDTSLRYKKVNTAMEELFGVGSENLINKTDIDLFGEEAGKHVMESDKQVLKGEIIEEFPTKPVNGVMHSFHTIKVPLKDPEGKITGICGIARDVTERKQAEKIQKTLFNISNALNTTDNMQDLYSKIREFLGDVIDTTNFYVALYDEKTDMISLTFDVDEKDDYETFPAGKTLTKYVIKTCKPLLAMKDVVEDLTKKGVIETIGTPSEIWLGVPLKIENKVIGVIAVQSYDDPHLYTEKDIEILTFISEEIALSIDKKRAEEQIKKNLKEKEVLLQEIHHRVKNNMQVISSLLRLQSRYITDGKALEFFKNSQNRVRSMVLIHESLYQSKDLAHIDFAEYVKKLTTQLLSSLAIYKSLIKLKINVKDIKMDINLAIPCGLIINELVSNSLKYAFPEGRKGELSISFTYENQTYILYVKDNGIGISEKINLKEPKTLGLQLVNSLTKQLHGTLELEKVKGTCFKITFKKTELKTYGKV